MMKSEFFSTRWNLKQDKFENGVFKKVAKTD